jgi:putative nucleotidyltransferase with HDIG domain
LTQSKLYATHSQIAFVFFNFTKDGKVSNNKTTLLIVDDEKTIRKLLRQKLSNEGYQCLEAGSTAQAQAELRNNSISLVILDIKLPGKSGIQLIPEINSNYPTTMIIMATATTDTSTAVHCMKQGAYDYLTKPFNLDEVVWSVTKALERRRLELDNRMYQQHLEEKVTEQARTIRTSFMNAITSLANALEAKDGYTSGHSQRVAEVAVSIARDLALPLEHIEKIRLAGLVHDIGKIGVKEGVLEKQGKLTTEEYLHITYHCELGERILAPLAEDEEILKIVRHHHENYDGNGYPDRLSGRQIPLAARILAVADTYDAIISDRPYRQAMSPDTARTEISKRKGTQFDPEIVEAFLRTELPLSTATADREATQA